MKSEYFTMRSIIMKIFNFLLDIQVSKVSIAENFNAKLILVKKVFFLSNVDSANIVLNQKTSEHTEQSYYYCTVWCNQMGTVEKLPLFERL